MVHSMTAFSLKENKLPSSTLSWEIRTVNHRFLDINIHLPDIFKPQENIYREAIRQHISRGKVDARLHFKSSVEQKREIQVNEPLARALIIACRQIEMLADTAESLKAVDILQWPGVAFEPSPEADAIAGHAHALLDLTLIDLAKNRSREGSILSSLIDQRCDQIAEIIVRIRKRQPEITELVRKKIINRIDNLNLSIDDGRLEQELVILAQRMDIAEELDRIMAHLDEVNQVLDFREPIGRRLDFLMQELNREANTIASKSHDTETTQLAVDLKVLIEQMREQVQNIQ